MTIQKNFNRCYLTPPRLERLTEDLTRFDRECPTEFDAVFGAFASNVRDSLRKNH